MRPCTRSASARSAREGRARTARPARRTVARISTHSSIEPSSLPQTPENLVDRRHRAVRILGDVGDREIRGEMRLDERAEGERDSRELAERAGLPDPISSRSPTPGPHSGTMVCASASAKREDQRVMADFDDHWRCRSFAALLPASLLLQGPRPPRAACSARRAWRASIPRGAPPAPPTRLRRPRPAPRGTGRAACPDKSPRPCWRCR